jgi:hypothetical protein
MNRSLRDLPDLGGGDEITDWRKVRDMNTPGDEVSVFQKIPI